DRARALHLQPGSPKLAARNGVGGRRRAARSHDRLDHAPLHRPGAGARGGARVKAGPLARQTILLLAGLLTLYPVYFMLSTAFKTRNQYLHNPYAFPWPLSLGNFSGAVHGATFLLWFK